MKSHTAPSRTLGELLPLQGPREVHPWDGVDSAVNAPLSVAGPGSLPVSLACFEVDSTTRGTNPTQFLRLVAM